MIAKRLSLLAISVAFSALALYAAGGSSGFLAESSFFLVRAFSISGIVLTGICFAGIGLAIERAARSRGKRGVPALIAYSILVLVGLTLFSLGESIIAIAG